MVDNEGSITGRFNYGWSPNNTTKLAMQVSLLFFFLLFFLSFSTRGKHWTNEERRLHFRKNQLPNSPTAPSMLSVEHDRVGKDYTLSFKSYNPSPVDLTGSYIAAYIQSITPHLAVGIETLYQRPTPQVEDCSVGYLAKYHKVEKDSMGQILTGSWIATGQIMSQGIWQCTYWKKLQERVDAGVDLMVIPSLDPRERKAVATAGVKYDFRMATFRGQVDSTGKVAALLEQRFSPAFAFLVAGEIDQVKVNFYWVFFFSLFLFLLC
jgi:mitochondrial import receptor subunit TOM40